MPHLPRLLHGYLKQGAESQPVQNRELLALLAEQKRTNRLLQGLVYGAVGFALGMLAMQVFIRIQLG